MNDILTAHKHSSNNEKEILASKTCSCFYCLKTFEPTDIKEWIDGGGNLDRTAICPHCEIDTVIGSASGYVLSTEFLSKMHEYWFK